MQDRPTQQPKARTTDEPLVTTDNALSYATFTSLDLALRTAIPTEIIRNETLSIFKKKALQEGIITDINLLDPAEQNAFAEYVSLSTTPFYVEGTETSGQNIFISGLNKYIEKETNADLVVAHFNDMYKDDPDWQAYDADTESLANAPPTTEEILEADANAFVNDWEKLASIAIKEAENTSLETYEEAIEGAYDNFIAYMVENHPNKDERNAYIQALNDQLEGKSNNPDERVAMAVASNAAFALEDGQSFTMSDLGVDGVILEVEEDHLQAAGNKLTATPYTALIDLVKEAFSRTPEEAAHAVNYLNTLRETGEFKGMNDDAFTTALLYTRHNIIDSKGAQISFSALDITPKDVGLTKTTAGRFTEAALTDPASDLIKR